MSEALIKTAQEIRDAINAQNAVLKNFLSRDTQNEQRIGQGFGTTGRFPVVCSKAQTFHRNIGTAVGSTPFAITKQFTILCQYIMVSFHANFAANMHTLAIILDATTKNDFNDFAAPVVLGTQESTVFNEYFRTVVPMVTAGVFSGGTGGIAHWYGIWPIRMNNVRLTIDNQGSNFGTNSQLTITALGE